MPPDFWYQPSVVRHLGCLDLPAVLRKVAAVPGWSQDDLARLLAYSRPTLNKIINGVRPLRVDELSSIVHALKIPAHLLGFADVGAVSQTIEARQSYFVVRQTTVKCAAIEREYGGNAVASYLVREVDKWAPVVRDSTSRPLIASFGELCALTGYAHYDAQCHGKAGYYYDVGLQAAHESGDRNLASQVRALMSMKATWLYRPGEGAAHCLAALEAARARRDMVTSMLLGRQARSESPCGDRRTVHRLLAECKEIAAASAPLDTPVAYWTSLEVFGNAGIAYKDIGEFALAEENLARAISLAGKSNSRDITLYLGMMSRLLLKQDRIEEAIEVVDRILASRVLSGRATKQLALFVAKTEHLYGSRLREVRARIRQVLAMSRTAENHASSQ
ncbi:hypothetical protein Acsp05_66790 [Actinokineospora sp. NBRC 105648]|nr:hypothetical protein Acsp05_66790 [Actinokineospora sp. NBRC 105648]